MAIALPWYVLVIWANGERFIDAFFGYHNFERFTSVVNRHWAPWYFYFLVVLVSFIPWSVYLPAAIARLRFWQINHWRQQPRSSHLGLFALTWFVVIFGFFTIAVTKLPSYTLPLLPAAAILVGLFWSDHWTEQMYRSRPDRITTISYIVNVMLFGALAMATFYSPNWLGNEPEMPDLPELMQQAGIIVSSVWIWAGATIAGILLLCFRRGRWLWLINVVSLIAFILIAALPTAVIVDVQRQLPLRQLSETIVQVRQPTEPVVMIGYSKPSVVFYTERSVTFFTDIDQVADDLQKLASHKRHRKASSLLLLGRTLKLKETEIPPEKYQAIARAGVFELVRIQMEDARAGLKKSQ
ncbi:MAG: hypothetical protein HC769_37000 [Cyanobacteria bacterium CRU_2_1]|nr:hypothetical protein [Cyanobacteria bacterium RU_5_0]NJR63873.1 hypothetical protein [Cyanobacteria bacterium CRU_2_1]